MALARHFLVFQRNLSGQLLYESGTSPLYVYKTKKTLVVHPIRNTRSNSDLHKINRIVPNNSDYDHVSWYLSLAM